MNLLNLGNEKKMKEGLGMMECTKEKTLYKETATEMQMNYQERAIVTVH